jgi:acyl-CoA thioester hydrolase
VSEIFTAMVQRRWADLDPQGHVNNTRIVDYLQEARTQLMLRELPGLLDRGCVVVSNQVEYQRPVRFSTEPVRVDIGVCEVGGARFGLDYVLWDAEERAVRARTVLCPFDFATASPRRLLAGERETLERFHGEDGAITPLRAIAMEPLSGGGLAYPLWPRWSDLDRYGHVNNMRLFDYVQEARVAVMERIDPAMARIGAGLGEDPSFVPLLWLVARQDVCYLAQVAHRLDPYEMRTACVHVGRTSMNVVAELVDPLADDAVLMRSVTVVVCADPSGVPMALPDHVREALLLRGGLR